MKKLFFLCALLVLSVPVLNGQSTDELEKQYRLLNRSIQEKQAVLDSLNGLIENMAKDIEREKKNSKPDENKIIKWMAHAVTVSNQIKAQQKEITVLRTSTEYSRARLERVYTTTIDSLRQLERTGQYGGAKKELQNQILFWTEKRVLVSPLVSTLTFDPQKVQEINLTGASDPLDRTIIEDYLENVLKEIDTHIQLVFATLQENEEMADLRRRTAEFVNEAYEQGRISTITRSQTVAKVTGTDILGNPIGTEFTTIQVRSVVGLIQQLNSGAVLNQTHASPILTKSGMTQEEYIQLLKQAEKQLKAYREMVQKKLK